jgi:tetratricopeptide (TPR) repeat protein
MQHGQEQRMSSTGLTNGAGPTGAQIVDNVQALLRAGDLAQATNAAQQALESGTAVHPLLLHLRALAFEKQGRIPEAVQDLKHGVDIAPNDPIAHFAFGQMLTKIGDVQNAGTAFDTTIRLRPDYAPAYRELGNLNCQVGEVEAGRRCYEKAISLQPNDADSLAGLAEIEQRAGNAAKARSLVERALAVAMNHPQARIVEAAILVESGKSTTRAEKALRQILDDPTTSAQDRTIVVSLLGDLRHSQKRYGEAFDAYARANAEKRAIFAPRFDRPGQENAFSYVTWLNEYLDVAPAESWRARRGAGRSADGPQEHVFVVGFPRSGTTLLENVLIGSPDVVALQEQNLLLESVRDLLSNDEGRARLSALSAEDAERYRGAYWQRAAQRGVQVAGKVFVDNNPLNVMKLSLVAKIFPDAKVLFAMRDPRDVVLSCFRSSFAMSPSMYEFLDLERAARFYDAVMRLGRSHREVLGLDWHDHRHEALVENFDSALEAVCSFVGIARVPAMSDFAELAKKRKSATRSAAQVKRGLSKDGVGTWRNYADRLAPVMSMLAPWVETFGYAPA